MKESVNSDPLSSGLAVEEKKDVFPIKVDPNALMAALGDSDPGRFMQALGNAGLQIGSFVSVWLKSVDLSKDDKQFVSGKVELFGDTSLVVSNPQKSYTVSWSDIIDLEVLKLGQAYGTHRLSYPFLGLDEAKLKPYLRELVSGKETLIKTERTDGSFLFAKVQLTRSKRGGFELAPLKEVGVVLDGVQEKALGLILKNSLLKVTDLERLGIGVTASQKQWLQEYMGAKAFRPIVIEGKEKLVLDGISKIGIVFSDKDKDELKTDGKLSEPVKVGDKFYNVVVDKELNMVRYAKVAEPMKKESLVLKPAQLISATKVLQQNGFKEAWVLTDSEDNIKKGIKLHEGTGASAYIIFEGTLGNPVPKLEVTWKGSASSDAFKRYVNDRKKAVAVLEDYFKGAIKLDNNKAATVGDAGVTKVAQVEKPVVAKQKRSTGQKID
jgi:hypothetical protein